jgi:hypothetical protein
MRISFIGNIGWRLDSSGNLTAFDNAGVGRAKIVNGVFSATGNISTFASGGAVVSTTSSTPVSTGQGTSITPQVSTRIVVIMFAAWLDSTTANGLVTLNLYRNTTGIPAAGSAATGTALNGLAGQNPSTTRFIKSPLGAADTGLVVGTTYFYYLAEQGPGVDTVQAGAELLFCQEI